MNSNLFSDVFSLLAPHLVVIFGILITSLWNLVFPKHKSLTPVFSAIAMLGACTLYGQQLQAGIHTYLFNKLYTVDQLSCTFGLFSCLIGTLIVLMTMGYERKFEPNRGEYYSILLAAVVSVMFLAGTTDLIMLFVSLETLTICCVLLSGFAKRDVKSNEAALKYLLSTAASTATFMYGLSFLYGMTASTNFYDIQTKLYQVAQAPSLATIMIIVLLISVVGFKLSLVPFHMWTPDVYEGAPTPVTAFLSVGSKLGGVVIAIRLLSVTFSSIGYWVPIIGALALLSMIAGNLIALAQRSVKRMLAYSSIAHVGYFLIALCANNGKSLSALVFYIIVYAFMNLGAFASAIIIENELGNDDIESWCGLITKRPWLSLGMAVCLLNLAGLPVPPAGFFAKFFVFWSGIQMSNGLGNALVAAGLITSIPAVFYYTRVVIKMIVKEPSAQVAALPKYRLALADSQLGPMLALTITIIGIMVASVAVNPLMEFSTRAIDFMNNEPVIGSVTTNTIR